MANERNAGRKQKYGEKSVRLQKLVPESKKEEIETQFDKILKEYETPKNK